MASFNLPNRPPNPGSFNRPPPPPRPPTLAPGWTEHKSPTGHPYYITKTSTYTRPVAPTPAPAPFAVGTNSDPYSAPVSYPNSSYPPRGHFNGQFNQQQFPNQQFGYGQSSGRGGTDRGGRPNNQRQHRQKSEEKPDRPKSKRTIPGATPWVLVTTKLGRTFVHNPETKVSLWKVPEDVQAAIDTMPPEGEVAKELKMKKKLASEAHSIKQEDLEPRGTKRPALDASEIEGKAGIETAAVDEEAKEEGEGGGEGGEEEGEDEEGSEDEGDAHGNKRLKTGETVEFTEDDVAWQLEAMAEEYGLGEEDFEEGEDMAEEDNVNLFKEMLSDYKTNPYSTWDAEMPRIVEDNRYVLVTTTKRRKEVFTEWCKDRIMEIKAEKAKQKKVDPKIPFWAFLKENASSKLYWPEFKRKFKKVSEMKDTKLTDKEKEKMYRDYISHMKISESLRENDLKKLLRSNSELSRSTPLEDLPESILTDVRYVTTPEKIRDAIVKDHLATLPEVPMNEAEKKAKEERERKQRAIRDREATVRREQWKLRGEEQRAKDMLREEEALIERAKVVSKKGLMGHIIKKEDEGEEAGKIPGSEDCGLP